MPTFLRLFPRQIRKDTPGLLPAHQMLHLKLFSAARTAADADRAGSRLPEHHIQPSGGSLADVVLGSDIERPARAIHMVSEPPVAPAIPLDDETEQPAEEKKPE